MSDRTPETPAAPGFVCLACGAALAEDANYCDPCFRQLNEDIATMPGRKAETPTPQAPTLAEAARALIQLWDRSDTRPAAPSRIAAGYEALRAALDAHEAAGAARLLAAVRAPAQADPLAAEVCRLQDEVGRLEKALREVP